MTANGLRRAVEGSFTFTWAAVGHNCALDRDGGYTSNDYGITCSYWAQKAFEELQANLIPGDVVVYRVANMHIRYYTISYIRDTLYPMVQQKGAKLILIGDSPYLRNRATFCLPSRFAPNALENCDTPRAQAQDAAKTASLQSLAALHPQSIFFFDLFDLFCEQTRCRATIPGTDTYWAFDEHHWTVAGGMYLWPFWCDYFSAHNWFLP